MAWGVVCAGQQRCSQRKAAKAMSKENKQHAGEKVHIEKQAAKDGNKRPQDDCKPIKSSLQQTWRACLT